MLCCAARLIAQSHTHALGPKGIGVHAVGDIGDVFGVDDASVGWYEELSFFELRERLHARGLGLLIGWRRRLRQGDTPRDAAKRRHKHHHASGRISKAAAEVEAGVGAAAATAATAVAAAAPKVAEAATAVKATAVNAAGAVAGTLRREASRGAEGGGSLLKDRGYCELNPPNKARALPWTATDELLVIRTPSADCGCALGSAALGA